MIEFKLKRDEARLIEQRFLPYMIDWCKMNVRKAKLTEHHEKLKEYLTAKVLLSLITSVQTVFKQKLLNSANKFSFKLYDAAGISFYMLLHNQPIHEKDAYMIKLRQDLCNHIHQQLFKDDERPAEDVY